MLQKIYSIWNISTFQSTNIFTTAQSRKMHNNKISIVRGEKLHDNKKKFQLFQYFNKFDDVKIFSSSFTHDKWISLQLLIAIFIFNRVNFRENWTLIGHSYRFSYTSLRTWSIKKIAEVYLQGWQYFKIASATFIINASKHFAVNLIFESCFGFFSLWF